MGGFIPREKQEKSKIKFFGRKDYINVFNHRKNKLDEERRNIYNIYGEGGIGKSSLLEEFEKECNVEDIKVIILDLKNINTRGAFYEKLFEQVGRKSIPTAHFLLGYLTYLKKKNPYFDINTDKNVFIEESGLLADIIDWSDLLVKEVDDAVPVVGSSIKLTVKFFKKIKDKIKLDSNITKYLKNSVEVEDIENQLGRFLSYDLINLSSKYEFPGVIFMFDTYEATNQDIKNEIKFLIKDLDNTKSMFVIMGRNEFQENEEWGKGYYSQELNRLSNLEVENILKNNMINDHNIVCAIRDSSKGNPLYLELMIQTYHNADTSSVEDFKDSTYNEIYERFMLYNKNDESTFELLSVARFINFDIYEELTNKGEREFNSFTKTTLFSVINDKYYMHDILQEHIISGLSRNRIVKLNQKMFEYYTRRIDCSYQNTISDEYYEESLYHLIGQHIEGSVLEEWLLDITSRLEKEGKYYLLFPLYEQTINSLESNDAQILFISLMKKNALESDKRREKAGSGLFEKYYKYIATEYNDEVNKLVFAWLDKFGWSPVADFVIIAYLQSSFTYGKDIKNYIRGWIKKYIDENIYVSLLLAEYLKKEDTKLNDLQDWIEIYLDKKEYSENFSFIFERYLEKGERSVSIDKKIIIWLSEYKNNKMLFSYVVQPYLNYGGSAIAIESSVIFWLDKYKDDKELFSYVVQAYLNQGGSAIAIESSVIFWLDKYKDEKELFSYVVQAYLNQGGSAIAIESSIIFWFDNNGKQYRQYVLPQAKKAGLKYKCENCIESFYMELYGVNQNNRIRNQKYKEIEKCLLKYSFSSCENKFTYFYLVSQYLKIENRNIEVAQNLLMSFSEYMLGMKESENINIIAMNQLYLKMKDKDSEVVFKIKNFYKNYLIETEYDWDKNQCEYFDVAKIYLKMENKESDVVLKIKSFCKNYLMKIDKNFYKNQCNYFDVIKIYLSMENKESDVILKIILLYENYLITSDKNIHKNQCQYYDIVKKYLSMEQLNQDIIIKIKNTLNTLPRVNSKCLSQYINILIKLTEYDTFIEIEKLEFFLKENIFFLRYYLLHPHAKINVIESYFDIFLNATNVSNTSIKKKYNPIINLYLSKISKNNQNKSNIVNFIERNINQKNITIIIFTYLLNDNCFCDIEKTVKLFLKEEGATEFLKKELERMIEIPNYIKLNPLKELLP